MNLYEYAVIKEDGELSFVVIGPCSVLALTIEDAKRRAIRAIPAKYPEIDIAKMKVIVRPFVNESEDDQDD